MFHHNQHIIIIQTHTPTENALPCQPNIPKGRLKNQTPFPRIEAAPQGELIIWNESVFGTENGRFKAKSAARLDILRVFLMQNMPFYGAKYRRYRMVSSL